jgi:hypothetical protein
MNLFKQRMCWAAVAGALAAPAAAQDVYLVARSFTKTMPDGVTVTMWGYAEDSNGFDTAGGEGPTTSPGPLIVVGDDDPTLTIHLRNELSVATSLMIPGQVAAMAPVFEPDGKGRQRVRSFTHVTAPGATGTYTWSNLRPGTYAYQSATHPQVQIQMGLYGPAKKDTSSGEAYPGVAYDAQIILFYSEIDPALHAAVASGDYGGPSYPSTLDYRPRYFLVNGEPHTGSPPAIAVGARGQRTLLRFINMGLRTHTPVLYGGDLSLVAEDGNAYPHPRQQYSVMLPAGKTRDAIFTPAAEGIYPIDDRMLSPGMLSYLAVGTSTAPQASGDLYSVAEDGVLEVAAPGVLGNDSPAQGLTASLVDGVTNGALSLNADGSFHYTPNADFSGNDGFSYRAGDGAVSSNVAMVTINVTAMNDAPQGTADVALATGTTPLVIAVLANDTDPDGDALSVASVSTPGGGTAVINADNTVTYTANAGTTSDAFTYVPFDGELNGAPVNVSVTVHAAVNHPPEAVDDTARAARNETITIAVLANDTDADGNIAPGTVTVTTAPNMGGTATVNGDGSITYTPRTNFRGTDTFAYTVADDAGAVSNEANVRVNVR